MTCEVIKIEGRTAIVCSRSGKRARCSVCKRNPYTRACDGPRAEKLLPGVAGVAVDLALHYNLCSAKLCDRCAVSFALDQDLCPTHAATAFASWAEAVEVSMA